MKSVNFNKRNWQSDFRVDVVSEVYNLDDLTRECMRVHMHKFSEGMFYCLNPTAIKS